MSTQEHKAYVQAVTDNASKRNVVQTPTVLINGKELQDTSLNGFNTAVKAAGGGAAGHAVAVRVSIQVTE